MVGTVRTLEFYSGIGGLHLSLMRSNVPGTVVRAFDWDQSACQVYSLNYGPNICNKTDISTLSASNLAPLQADLWLLSPSCQPYVFSLNPLAKGAADPRAKSFLHLIETVLPDLVSAKSHPRYLLVENVGGFETSTTRQLVLSTLKALGYTTFELLLTPLQFNIPNSRLRYYLLAKMGPLSFSTPGEGRVWRHIPGYGKDWVDPRSLDEAGIDHSGDEISRYLDKNETPEQLHSHAVPDRILEKWGKLFDIVLPTARRSCCFTRGYTQLVERAGSVLQMNDALDTTQTFDAFARAQAEGDPEAVRVLAPLRLRYFTPAELLRLFHFDLSHIDQHQSDVETFVWPPGITTKTKYRLVGNSVNVKVVTALINFLFQ